MRQEPWSLRLTVCDNVQELVSKQSSETGPLVLWAGRGQWGTSRGISASDIATAMVVAATMSETFCIELIALRSLVCAIAP